MFPLPFDDAVFDAIAFDAEKSRAVFVQEFATATPSAELHAPNLIVSLHY
jgi:hypothetical protein